MDSPQHFFTGLKAIFWWHVHFSSKFSISEFQSEEMILAIDNYSGGGAGAQMTSSWNNCICEVLKLWVIIDNLAIYDCGNIVRSGNVQPKTFENILVSSFGIDLCENMLNPICPSLFVFVYLYKST